MPVASLDEVFDPYLEDAAKIEEKLEGAVFLQCNVVRCCGGTKTKPSSVDHRPLARLVAAANNRDPLKFKKWADVVANNEFVKIHIWPELEKSVSFI